MIIESQSAQPEFADTRMLPVGVSTRGGISDRPGRISLRTPITDDGLGGTTGE